MALLNGIYLHVTDESFASDIDKSTHSVEDGIDITDTVKARASTLSLSGEIVNYTANITTEKTEPEPITAWISMVKRFRDPNNLNNDDGKFDTMSFERLNSMLIFEGGAAFTDTGAIQYFDPWGTPYDCSTSLDKVIAQVKFEVSMPYQSKVRIADEYAPYCCFNIINKSTTSYDMRDYDADATTYSNTYNGEFGRVRTDFENTDGQDITAWISMVKRNGKPFDDMSVAKIATMLDMQGSVTINTNTAQFFDESGQDLGSTGTQEGTVVTVKFEVAMAAGDRISIKSEFASDCCFNIINKSTTGYEVRDYDADAENSAIYTSAGSNTYNGESGRVRTEFTNLDDPSVDNPETEAERTAPWVIEQMTAFMKSGALVKYEGRNLLDNYQITSFTTTHPNTVNGGAEFSMELEEFRGAVNSYVAPTSATSEYIDDTIPSEGVQQIQQGDGTEVWYEVQAGDSLYNLVGADNAQYRYLNREAIDGQELPAMEWVMQKNPDAFEVYGDPSTLKAYVSIVLGTR